MCIRDRTKLFLSNGNTNWTNHINNIVEHYNRQPHGSLDGLSPNDARKQEHDETITNLNIEKSKANSMVSELQAGDYVRKNVLLNESFSKGTDNKWSNKVFRVESARGNRIILNDKSIYKRVNLLKVSENAQSYQSNAIDDNKKENRKLIFEHYAIIMFDCSCNILLWCCDECDCDTSDEILLDGTCLCAVSYTHLTLPTKRIV